MTRAAVRPHPCNQDHYAVCTCERPGLAAFGLNTRSRTDLAIERTFEFVEAAADGQTFTVRDIQSAVGAGGASMVDRGPTLGMVEKTLRLMAHLGYVEKIAPGGPWHPDAWRRSAPVGAEAAS